MSANAIGLVRVLKALREQEAKEAKNEAAGAKKITRYVDLPKEKWYTCTSCHGKGSYFMEGDLHRSSGVVPCNRCRGGLIKGKYVEEWVWPKVPYYG